MTPIEDYTTGLKEFEAALKTLNELAVQQRNWQAAERHLPDLFDRAKKAVQVLRDYAQQKADFEQTIEGLKAKEAEHRAKMLEARNEARREEERKATLRADRQQFERNCAQRKAELEAEITELEERKAKLKEEWSRLSP